MLPNEKFALECRARYEEQGLIVDQTNGEFAHCPLPKEMGDKGYYLLWEDHQHQGLLQSKDIGRCCFFVGDAKRWLGEHGDFSEDFSELWDTYWKYSGDLSRKNIGEVHKEKDEEGKSLLAVRMGKKVHESKDANGKSLHTLKLHEAKNEEGKSLVAVKAGNKTHEAKNEEGKSLHALKINAKKNEEGKSAGAAKGGKKTSSQIWESTIDGFRSTPSAVARHNRARGWDPAARIRIS
jgi:hypothetical protein